MFKDVIYLHLKHLFICIEIFLKKIYNRDTFIVKIYNRDTFIMKIYIKLLKMRI